MKRDLAASITVATAGVEATAKLCGCYPDAAVRNSAALTLLKPY